MQQLTRARTNRSASGGLGSASRGRPIFFLSKFLRDPKHVASVWPSSRSLGAAMVDGVEPADGQVIVELGPGTGAFTVWIDAVLRRQSSARYLGIERDPEFCAHLAARFPRLAFASARVEDCFERLDAERGKVAAVISGLPLVTMPPAVQDEILERVREALAPGGVFRTFSYLHLYGCRKARGLRRRVASVFDDFAVRGPIFRNVPPAVVLSGQVRDAPQRARASGRARSPSRGGPLVIASR